MVGSSLGGMIPPPLICEPSCKTRIRREGNDGVRAKTFISCSRARRAIPDAAAGLTPRGAHEIWRVPIGKPLPRLSFTPARLSRGVGQSAFRLTLLRGANSPCEQAAQSFSNYPRILAPPRAP
jgi:hypothetical protein